MCSQKQVGQLLVPASLFGEIFHFIKLFSSCLKILAVFHEPGSFLSWYIKYSYPLASINGQIVGLFSSNFFCVCVEPFCEIKLERGLGEGLIRERTVGAEFVLAQNH